MCELFGVSSAARIRVDPFLRTLLAHSTDHPHGWGMAIFYGGFVNIEKEPKPAFMSDYLRTRLAHPVEVKNMIAHIRYATQGSMVYENCHPFVTRDASDCAWTLAHNGTIFESALLDAYRPVQEGGTDSERILCHIIREMNRAGQTDAAQRFAILDKIVLNIAEHNKVNLLIFDGETLYVHANMRGTLFRTQRDDAMLFATVPLDNGHWEPVPMMRLLAYRDGKLIAEGTQHEFEYMRPDPALEASQWSVL